MSKILVGNKIERRDKLVPVIREIAAFARFWVEGIHEVQKRPDVYPTTNWNSFDFLWVDPHKDPFYVPERFVKSDIDGTEAIRCEFNQYCFIELYNFRPKSGSKADITVLPSELLEEKIKSIEKKVYENNLNRPDRISYERTHEYEVVKALLSEFILEVEAAMKQTISYGGEIWGIGGETEVELRSKFGAKFENATTTTSKKIETLKWEGSVPPKTTVVVDWTQSVGRHLQKVIFEGAIDYSTRLVSHGDVDARWQDQQEFMDCLKGIGIDEKHGVTNWGRLLSRFPINRTQRYDGPGNVNGFVDPDWYKDLICPDVYGRVEREFEFENSSQIKRSISQFQLTA